VRLRVLLAALLLVAPCCGGGAPPPRARDTPGTIAAPPRSTHAIVEVIEDQGVLRSARTLETWTLGADRALARVLRPAHARRQSFLEIGDRAWGYSPAFGLVERADMDDRSLEVARLIAGRLTGIETDARHLGPARRATLRGVPCLAWHLSGTDLFAASDGRVLELRQSEAGRETRRVTFSSYRAPAHARPLASRIEIVEPKARVTVTVHAIEVDVALDERMFAVAWLGR